jgi:ribosome maturation factor RimP
MGLMVADPNETRFIRESGKASEIADLAEPVLDELGFRLVRVQVSGRDGGTVQVMAERPDGSMTLDDCVAITRRLSPLLDAHDPIADSYRLEVSSPGIDRPLVRVSDFEVWRGHEAKIELKELLGGRRRFRGWIEGADSSEVRLRIEGEAGSEEVSLPLHLIEEAKLVESKEAVRADLASKH